MINTEDLNLLKDYKAYNSDVYGIIRIKDTVLNHPFMYTPDDESFYLNRDLDKKQNSHGVPFLAVGSAFGQPGSNSVIYGHNITITEKDIFADLYYYEDLEFYKEHPIIETVTEYGSRKWLIFAYYLVDNEDEEFAYWETQDFTSNSLFVTYMDEVKKRNWLNVDIPLTMDSSYITLSSCSNELSGSGTNRMVVMAKLLKNEEDVSAVISNAARNYNALLPTKLRGE